MKVIKILGSENTHIPYLYNKVMPLATQYRCGGLYNVGKGDVKVNAWSDIVLNNLKKAFNELKIKFTEIEE